MPDSFAMGNRTAEALRMLSPGPVRRRYLRLWLDRELPMHLNNVRYGRLAAFSLLLHDHPRDVVRAVSSLGRARLRRQSDMNVFAGIATC
jgi:hypothetical protein